MNVYIDCGAWTGDSVLEFKKHYPDYKVYAFECHPDHHKHLERLSKKYDFTYINKAVWIKDETISFYLGTKDRTQASTLHKNKKKKIDRKNPISVEAIDFSKWVLDTFSPDDNIVCKMNIEGAEYEILPRMIVEGTIRYIKKLYVAWHYSKLHGFNKDLHDSLIRELTSSTKLKKWDYDERNGKNPF